MQLQRPVEDGGERLLLHTDARQQPASSLLLRWSRLTLAITTTTATISFATASIAFAASTVTVTTATIAFATSFFIHGHADPRQLRVRYAGEPYLTCYSRCSLLPRLSLSPHHPLASHLTPRAKILARDTPLL